MSDDRFRWRLRLVAVSAALTALAFVQSPGQIVNDTKYDLAVRPGLFIDKVLHLWDPIGQFGQVQNQAYGYLFPMGPFFGIGHVLEAPAWIVQRAWWALILVVAFLGIVKLCRVLDVGTPWARVLAGVVFALSPRMLTNLGPISIENWPSAVAPWVLIPLVIGARRGSARQAAARSGLAAAAVGGVNAVASAAILPLSALWLLTRKRGPRRAVLMRWWPVFVGLATLWWLVPLLVLGRYSPPFLDYIESSTGTTVTGTLADALRGTTKWVPYVNADYSAGRTLLTQPLAILQTGLLVILGLLGLVRRDLVERRFLVISLLAGVVLVTMGHRGAFQGFFSLDLNQMLDGVLAPLRNTHKWDVLIRLPLVIGLAHFVSVVGTKIVDNRREKDEGQAVLRVGVATLALAAFIGGSSVAFSVSLASAGSFDKTPNYWVQAASWLEDHDDGRRTYVAPGSPFGDYVWGRPMDEAVQALADAPWATRSAIPLVPGENIRMMDAIETELVNGSGSAELHDYLSRAGIGHVLIRNDLRPTSSTPNPTLVRAAISQSPGLVRVAAFGPQVGGEARLDDGNRPAIFVNDGHQSMRPAIEIYRVTPRAGEKASSTYSSADLPVFVGDSSSLLRASGLEVMGDGPLVFARDHATEVPRPSTVILTDGSRRQEADFGRVQDNRSASLAPDEPWRTSRVVHDYDTGTPNSQLTVPRLRGAASITASSSSSDAGFAGTIDQSAQPFSAFDGDVDTAWVSGLAVDGRHELRVDLETPTDVESVRLSVPYVPGAENRPVRVSTSAGTVTTEITPGDTKVVRTAPGTTSFVSVTARSDLGRALRISELTIPGVDISRPLAVPALPDGWGTPDAVVLAAGGGTRSGCVPVDGDQRCAEGVQRLGEDGRTIHRVVPMSDPASYAAEITVQPWGRDRLTSMIQRGRGSVATASSQATDQALSGAYAAVDDDPDTGWIASGNDRDPSLEIAWDEPQRISGIQLTTSPSLVASTATGVVIDFDNGESREVGLRDGRATFDAVTASRATVRLVGRDEATSLSLDGRSARALPVGVSELTFRGAALDTSPLSRQVRDLECGSGPELDVDGDVFRTKVRASASQLYRGETVSAVPCGAAPLQLSAGESDIRVGHTASLRPLTLELTDPTADTPAPSGGAAATTTHRDAASTRVTTPTDAELLVLRVNSNEGWEATAGSERLDPVVVDGWQQGWVLPDGGTRAVSLHFAPDTTYRWGLAAGAVGILLTAVAALLPRFGRARRDLPSSGPAQPGWILATITVGAVAAFVGGWPGLAAWGAGWGIGSIVALVGRRRGVSWSGWPLGVLGLATVYSAYALRPWGGATVWMGREAWPQLVTLAALSVLLAGAFMPETSRLARRIAGRSTE